MGVAPATGDTAAKAAAPTTSGGDPRAARAAADRGLTGDADRPSPGCRGRATRRNGSGEQETEGEYRPGSGSLYPVLKKLYTSGITEKLPVEDGVYRYRLTDRGHSFFEEHFDIMQEVRKKLDSVEFPFANLFQNNPQFRTYFMRISKVMMTISEMSDEGIDPELAKQIEKTVSRSANELEEILKTIKSRENIGGRT